MRIDLTASTSAADAIAALGRTEDVCFSPANDRVAIAGFNSHRITLIDLAIQGDGGLRVEATGSLVLSSEALNNPHGCDFLDNHTLVVTNRAGELVVFTLPERHHGGGMVTLTPIQRWGASDTRLLNWPGSVTVEQRTGSLHDILVCNNVGNTVTTHRLDLSTAASAIAHEVRLAHGLDVPDGVTVSRDGAWIAVSNHNTHSVFVYRNDRSLSADSEPTAILRRVHYPHGLRFTADGRYLFVADAGAPYLNVYERGDGWHGVRAPLASLRIVDEARFGRGHHNLQEGGPKGIAIDSTGRVLALTAEHQPLEFYSVAAAIEEAHRTGAQPELDLRFELAIMAEDRRVRTRNQELTEATEYMENSQSWKLTAPLRRLQTALTSR